MSESRALVLLQTPQAKWSWASEQEVIEALRLNKFHIAQTAEYFGVRRRELAARIDASPALQEEIEDFDEAIMDDVEFGLRKRASNGDKDVAALFANSEKGRRRGYGKANVGNNLPGGIEVIIRQIGSE